MAKADADDRPGELASGATSWAAAFVGLAVAARAVRWQAEVPLWGDEAAVALNLLERGFHALARPLEMGQVAPLGFLWLERATLLALGAAETSLRLPAVLAGIAAVLVFWQLCRLALAQVAGTQPLDAVLPLAIFAVSYYPIRYSAELKPYSLDLLCACVFLWLAARWLLDPQRRHSALWALGAFALIAPWLSYPSVFVGGAVAIALLPALFAQRRPAAITGFLVFVAVLGASSLASYLWIGRPQTQVFDGSGAWLTRFWSASFPPAQPLAFLRWLLGTHTGMLFAYPNGGPNGGSTLSFLLALLGAGGLWRRSQRILLALLLGPFALNFAAACLRLYPYGGHPRIALFLAPSICLLAGIGLALLLARLPTAEARARARRVVLGALVLLGIGTIARDLVLTHGARDAVTQGQKIARALAADDRVCIVSLNRPEDLVAPDGGPDGPQASFRFSLRQAAGARFSAGVAGLAACAERDRLRAIVFSADGRPDPGSRFEEWESETALRAARIRTEMASRERREGVFARDYVRRR